MKTLILYFTTDGQTKKIAERLADVITHEVELISLKEQAVDFAEKLQMPIKLSSVPRFVMGILTLWFISLWNSIIWR